MAIFFLPLFEKALSTAASLTSSSFCCDELCLVSQATSVKTTVALLLVKHIPDLASSGSFTFFFVSKGSPNKKYHIIIRGDSL